MTPSSNRGPSSGAGALFDPARLIRLGVAVAVGMVIAFVLFLATADGVATLGGGRLGGDWAAFYSAGELARTAPQLILDAEAQAGAQEPYVGGAFVPFPYPPVLAFLFAPLSLLSFRASYAIYVLLLASAGIWAVRMTLDVLDVRAATWRRLAMLGAMTFAPTLRSVGGAQNATITLLLVAGGFKLLRDDRPVLAGLVFGLMWFKPQYAIPVLGLLIASGRWWRPGLLGLVPAAALWITTAGVFGVDWVQKWWREIISITNAGNKVYNTGQTVSPVEYLRGRLPEDVAEALGFVTALAVGCLFLALVRQHRAQPSAVYALGCCALLLSALHALPYELVLLVPVIGAAMVALGPRAVPLGVAFYLSGWVVILDVHPLVRVAYVVAVTAITVAALRARRNVFTEVRRPGARRPTSP